MHFFRVFFALSFVVFALSVSVPSLKITVHAATPSEAEKKAQEVIHGCVRSRSDKSLSCETSQSKLRPLIQSDDEATNKIILKQVGKQRSQEAREYLWPLVSEFKGKSAARALRDFYLKRPVSAPAKFFQYVQSQFVKIADQDDLDDVLSEYLNRSLDGGIISSLFL